VDYTPQQVLDKLKASRSQISNATFECVWKTINEAWKGPNGITYGGVPQWEKQTFYWDDLGRRRNILHRGLLSKDGTLLEAEDPFTEDTIYNGEIVVNSEDYPERNRIGEKLKLSKGATGYNAVIIGDAASPLRSGLESSRNPLGYISNVALHEIDTAITRRAIVANTTEDGRVVLVITHGESKSPYTKSTITVAPKHNWAIESIKSYRSDGGLSREIVYEYREQQDGLWVPIKGWHTHWGERNQNAKPHFDWRFEATKAVYNAPSFDQHVFDVRLKPDAAVSDTRYKVAYRIGSEAAVAADLARYAADARKEAEKSKLPESRGEVSRLEPSQSRKVVLVVTTVLLIASICILIMRRIRRRAQYRPR
jgi:hypothetical protein